MEFIEEVYCNFKIERILCFELVSIFYFYCLNFNVMIYGVIQVCCFFMVFFVIKFLYFIFIIDWIWYWSDEFGFWQEYGRQGMVYFVIIVSSSDVEKVYLVYCILGFDGQVVILKFQVGKYNYELDFKVFVQKNLVYGIIKKVCCRFKYVFFQDVMIM